jgi:cell shape-determining protein MreC
MEEKVRQVTLQNETLKAKLAHYEHQDENQNTLSREHMRFTATDMNSNSEI